MAEATIPSGVIPRFFSPVFMRDFRQDNLAVQDCRNVTSGFQGDRVVFDKMDADGTLTSRNVNSLYASTDSADFQWGKASMVAMTAVNLISNTLYTFNEEVNYPLDLHTAVNMATERASILAINAREKINNDVRDAIFGLGTTADVTANPSHAGVRKSGITVKTGEWGNPAHITALSTAWRNMAKEADGLKIPRMASMRKWRVGPEIYDLLIEKFVTDRLLLVRGANDTAQVNGEVMEFRGMTYKLDNSMGVGHAATEDANAHMAFYVPGTAMGYIQTQFRMTSEDQFGVGSSMNRVNRGAFQFGTALLLPRRMRIVPGNITA